MWYSICYKGYPNLPDDAASATDWPEATCDGGAGVKFEQIPLFYPRGCAAHEDLHLEPEQVSKLRTCHNRDLQVARSLDDSLLSPSFPDAFWLEGLRPPGPPRLPYPAPDIEVRDSESSDRDSWRVQLQAEASDQPWSASRRQCVSLPHAMMISLAGCIQALD